MMFGRMLSRVLRNLWRIPAIMAVVAIVLSVVTRFVMLYLWDNVGNYRFTVPWVVRAVLWLFLSFYALYMIVANVLVELYLPVRFYKEVYSNQGYLYHSLPLTKTQILLAHTIGGGLLSMLFWLLDLLCMWIAIRDLEEVMAELTRLYFMMVRELRPLIAGLESELTVLTVVMIITVVLSPFIMLLQMYCAVALGQMHKKHRVPMAVAWYFGLNFILSIVNGIVTGIASFAFFHNLDTYSSGAEVLRGVMILFVVSMLLMILEMVVFFVVTQRLMTTRLDLE